MRYSICYMVGEKKFFIVLKTNEKKIILAKLTKQYQRDDITIKYAKELQSALDSIWQTF